MRCDCGGALRRVRLKAFDFTPLAGIPSELRKVPGLRCGDCGYETVPGFVINGSLEVLALAVAQYDHRLTKELAIFLRKRLRITQQELADRMGISRETVAKWECGRNEISASHDMILRTLVVGSLAASLWGEPMRKAVSAFAHVRTEPPVTPPPFVLEKELESLRATEQ
jgi:transcriptional regulator with XRE-family HTH domain